jgi:hypothetical protein
MTANPAATDLARELYGYTDGGELAIPAGILIRAMEAREIWPEPCDYCHGDGEHETWCTSGYCTTCNLPPQNCICDERNER